jgi:hypothetical protein
MSVTRNCPGCGATVASERFCGICGSAIPQFHQDYTAPSASAAGVINTPHTIGTSAVVTAPTAVSIDRPHAPDVPDPDSGCQFCADTPSVDATFRQETGMIFWRTRSQVDGRFCRNCGVATFRELQNRTLMTGWWGVLSFFTNWLTLFRNIASVQRIRALPLTDPGGSNVAAMDPGKPLFQRGGIWVAAVVIVILGAAVASEARQESDYSYSGGTSYTPATMPRYTPSYGGSAPSYGGSSWSYAEKEAIRSAASDAGYSWTEAQCITSYITARYSPSSVSATVVNAAVNYCS